MPSTNGVYVIHEESRSHIPIFVDACETGTGAICGHQVYHATFPAHMIHQPHPICHLEALNALAAVKNLDPTLHGALLHLYTDNTMAAAIFERGRGRDSFIQACARELWLVCTEHDLTQHVTRSRWIFDGNCWHTQPLAHSTFQVLVKSPFNVSLSHLSPD